MVSAGRMGVARGVTIWRTACGSVDRATNKRHGSAPEYFEYISTLTLLRAVKLSQMMMTLGGKAAPFDRRE